MQGTPRGSRSDVKTPNPAIRNGAMPDSKPRMAADFRVLRTEHRAVPKAREIGVNVLEARGPDPPSRVSSLRDHASGPYSIFLSRGVFSTHRHQRHHAAMEWPCTAALITTASSLLRCTRQELSRRFARWHQRAGNGSGPESSLSGGFPADCSSSCGLHGLQLAKATIYPFNRHPLLVDAGATCRHTAHLHFRLCVPRRRRQVFRSSGLDHERSSPPNNHLRNLRAGKCTLGVKAG
ncbi:hypothetical protein MAPG_11889 [Magnaporthiopsis poae ATCC 64411]|uniref:Uncharacterized protein n=1 Tax=Magnaporthiopsis poae (strain ATCC 64411 / 73-15) TaxID=644358 RepID=A0A0C4EGF2_MAGP6|nr:hypothetical protein MAPG_11889 [Magnaporthiopsis poae ATCC 64411]